MQRYISKPTNLLFLLIALFSISSRGQQRQELRGEVRDVSDLESIHVMNLNSRYNTITNQDGAFVIAAKANDTLMLSSVQYEVKKVVITQKVLDEQPLIVYLKEAINELDEVYLGPKLTGNLSSDLKNIKTERQLNFDDVGIPGFKGEHEEKIPNLVGQVITPVSVDVEGLYKYISGYYKKLKKRREWQQQNENVAALLVLYSSDFFSEAFQIPEHRTYDFLLFCLETSDMKNAFIKEDFAHVIAIFEAKAPVYRERFSSEE